MLKLMCIKKGQYLVGIENTEILQVNKAYLPKVSKRSLVSIEMCIFIGSPVVSILLAVFTVSPILNQS